LKSTLFLDVTPCTASIFRVLLGLLFHPQKKTIRSSDLFGDFIKLHDVTSQKIVFFTVIALRISNVAYSCLLREKFDMLPALCYNPEFAGLILDEVIEFFN
jgi:hypothetical protein